MSPTSAFLRRLESFRFAGRGLITMLRTEPNARIHAFLALASLVAGAYFEIGRGEWLAVVLAIGLVFGAEAVNTAFEALCDVASPGRHPQVERAKDVAAGGVLAAALSALAVAVIVFGPRLLRLFEL